MPRRRSARRGRVIAGSGAKVPGQEQRLGMMQQKRRLNQPMSMDRFLAGIGRRLTPGAGGALTRPWERRLREVLESQRGPLNRRRLTSLVGTAKGEDRPLRDLWTGALGQKAFWQNQRQSPGPPVTDVPGPKPPINPNVPGDLEGAPTTPLPPGGLTPNPQLAGAPLGAYTDAEYEAQRALLERETRQQYADVLRQLGYEEGGVRVPGEVETLAERQRRDLGTNLERADLGARRQAQQEGNIFSGYFAENLAQAREPSVRGLADLEIETPIQLADLRQQALGLLSDYELQHYALLADAAARRRQGLEV